MSYILEKFGHQLIMMEMKMNPFILCLMFSLVKSKSKEQILHFGPKQKTKVIINPPSHHPQIKFIWVK